MSLTDSQMMEIFDREVRRECEWTRMQREALPDIVRYTEMDSPDGGYISWSALTSETADERIQEQIAHYRSLKMEFEWKIYSYDTPADLPQRLLKHGFSAGDPEALMLAGMDDLPESYWTMDATAVTRITTPEGVDEIVLMESEVWGKEKSGFSRGMKFDLVHNPDHLSVFAVRQNDRVVERSLDTLPGWDFLRHPVGRYLRWRIIEIAVITPPCWQCAPVKHVRASINSCRWTPVPTVSPSWQSTVSDIWRIPRLIRGNRTAKSIWQGPWPLRHK